MLFDIVLAIIVAVALLITGIFEAIKALDKEHSNNRKKYRKYLISRDKKGKQPLSYKQWKFAYGVKYKPSVHVSKNKNKEERRMITYKHKKTYGWQYWE